MDAWLKIYLGDAPLSKNWGGGGGGGVHIKDEDMFYLGPIWVGQKKI
jgi:hypothetical protein